MANDSIIDLINIMGEGHENVPSPSIHPKSPLELTKIIMMCDKAYPHPIHTIIRYDFKKDMRMMYLYYDFIMKYLLKRMSLYPIDEERVGAIEFNIKRFKELKITLQIQLGSEYNWYNLLNFKPNNYFRIHEDLETCTEDLGVRSTNLRMIYNAYAEAVESINDRLIHHLYMDDLNELIHIMQCLRSFLTKLGKAIDKIHQIGV